MLLLSILSYVFEAVVRYWLDQMGLPFLIYFKNFVFLLLILLGLTITIVESRINKILLLMFLVMFSSSITGLLNGLGLYQVLFGLNILLPLLAVFIYFYYFEINIELFIKMYRILVPIVFFGLILDSFYELPWQGLNYQIGDINIVGNLQWWAVGIDRLSGFQRASFDSAIIIYAFLTLYFINLLFSKRKDNFFVKSYDFVLLLFCLISIGLTTSKSSYVAVLSIIILYLLVIFYRKTSNFKYLPIILIKFSLLTFYVIAIIPPLLSFFNPIWVLNLKAGNTFFYKFFIASYMDRILNMWPNAFSLLEHTNIPFFGRGLGSIGMSQLYFEPSLYNSADNFFVYIYVVAGIPSFILIFYILYSILTLRIDEHKGLLKMFLLVAILNYGSTVNVIELTGLTILVGILLALISKNYNSD